MSDFNAVTHIRESNALDISRLEDADYRVQIERSGFLLPTELNIANFQANVSNYTVAERGGKVAGYLRLSKDREISPKEGAFWLRPDLKETYYSDPHVNIWGICVLPETMQRGVATKMLQAAERRVRAKNVPWLFSGIISSPVTNVASLLFHEKNGFKRIALTDPVQEHDMKGFQYLLYGKQLS